MSRRFVLVPAAGGSTRFGGSLPKQYVVLAGLPILAHALARVCEVVMSDAVFIALATDDLHYDRMTGRPKDAMVLRCGGATRAETVRNALAELASRCSPDDWLLVHDAARPCVPREALVRLLEHLRDDRVGGLLAVPVADTLKQSNRDVDAPRASGTIPRAGLWQAQTPQMFRFGVLQRAFARCDALACTDEAQAVEALGEAPLLVRGSTANIKITYPDDLALAAAIMAAQAAQSDDS